MYIYQNEKAIGGGLQMLELMAKFGLINSLGWPIFGDEGADNRKIVILRHRRHRENTFGQFEENC